MQQEVFERSKGNSWHELIIRGVIFIIKNKHKFKINVTVYLEKRNDKCFLLILKYINQEVTKWSPIVN